MKKDELLTISNCMKSDWHPALRNVERWESNSSSCTGVVAFAPDAALLVRGELSGPWLQGRPGLDFARHRRF